MQLSSSFTNIVWLNGHVVDVKIHKLKKGTVVAEGKHCRVSGLVVELKFLGLCLEKNIAWWSGLVVDVKKHRPENIMLLKWAHTQERFVV